MKRILLCPPTYYDIDYEINPWMHLENKVVHEKALDSYNTLKDIYNKLPVEVYEIEPQKGLPDMIYSANFGHVESDTFVGSNFKFPVRRQETFFAEKYFKKEFGFKIQRPPENIFFEGQGDLLQTPSKYFLGWGKRSSRKAKDYLTPIFSKPIIHLELVDPVYYHLDMSLAPLSENTVVIKEESFTSAGLQTIRDNFSDIIVPGAEDQKIMACNLVVVENNIVLGKGISASLKQEFGSRGFTVYEVPMEEYRKGGGSVKCSTLEF
jgi:N-dimethylarginine dimethylaminohydrolase